MLSHLVRRAVVMAHLVVVGIRMMRHRFHTTSVLYVMRRLCCTRRLVTSSLRVTPHGLMLCLYGTRFLLLTYVMFVSSMFPAAPLMPCLLVRAIACLSRCLADIPAEQPKARVTRKDGMSRRCS
jgi:hypothetical protein